MTHRPFSVGRTTLAAIILLGGVGPTSAQAPGLIDHAKALRELADSKADADTKNALAEADKLAKASTPGAVRKLKLAILTLDKSVEITSVKRAALVKQLEDKVAVLEGRAPEPAKTDKPAAAKKIAEAVSPETKEIRDGLAAVEKLYDANKYADAQVKINELTRKHPNNPAVLALAGQGFVKDRVAEAKELSRQQAERVTLALNDVQRSALPARGDIEFPKGWKEKMEARDRLTYEQMDADSIAILEALEKPLKSGIKTGPFQEVIQSLSDLTQKNIFVNEDALREAGIDLKKPVTVPDGVTVRTALRAVLQANRLTFIIKDKSILVVTPDEASKMLVKRVYYMGDVLGTPLGGGATLGPLLDFNLATQNATMIIDSIKKSIDPLSWANPGGGGGNSSILFHAPSMSIIVSAPAEVHYTLGHAVRPKK